MTHPHPHPHPRLVQDTCAVTATTTASVLRNLYPHCYEFLYNVPKTFHTDVVQLTLPAALELEWTTKMSEALIPVTVPNYLIIAARLHCEMILSQPECRNFGLCVRLVGLARVLTDDTDFGPKNADAATRRILRMMFHELDLNMYYPFNDGVSTAYADELHPPTLYKNPLRVAFLVFLAQYPLDMSDDAI